MSEKRHELKCWPPYFGAVVEGRKRFEYRLDDRGFDVGDVLHLREWSPLDETYTGRTLDVRVTYLLRASPNDYVVMSIDHEERPLHDELVAMVEDLMFWASPKARERARALLARVKP